MTPTIRLLGLEFAAMDAPAAAAWLSARPAGAPFGYVVTPNADHFVRLARDPALAPLYGGALLRLLDSRVVAGAARLRGLACPPVAPGSDLAALLLTPGERITLIGLDPSHLPALVARHGLAPPAHHQPPMDLDRNPQAMAAAVGFALAHPARFTFLALGSPRQERLAAAIAATGRARGIGLCVGASLDFLAGAQRRAPAWMQARGLEWLHRLAHDPARLAGRYLRDSPAVFGLVWRAGR